MFKFSISIIASTLLCASVWAAGTPFLSADELAKLDITKIVPPTPKLDSETDQQDVAIFWATRSLLLTGVGTRAANDDVYVPADVWPRFVDSLHLTRQPQPAQIKHLLTIIERAQQDGSNLVKPLKQELPLGRARPFVRFAGAPSCLEPVDIVPGHRDLDYGFGLKTSGSYPSTHALIGLLWGMTLGELVPEAANETLERGIAFGESRVICGFHFQSDIQAGRMAARALFLRLHKNKDFMKEMAAAKAELKALR